MSCYPEPTPVAIITDGRNDDNAAPPPRPPPLLPPPFDYLHTSPLPAAAVDTVGGCECAEGACGAGCPCVAAHKEALDALVRAGVFGWWGAGVAGVAGVFGQNHHHCMQKQTAAAHTHNHKTRQTPRRRW
jgi:hypothetical protein